MFNRNKKSIAIDLRNAEGVQAAIRLASTADVVLQNFKPGVMKSTGWTMPRCPGSTPALSM